MDVGGSLIRYSKCHTKKKTSSITEALLLLFTEHYSFNWNVSTLQSSQYWYVTTDLLGTSRGSLAIRGAHFGRRCFCTVWRKTSKSWDGHKISYHTQEFCSANPNHEDFSQRKFLKPWLSRYLHTDHVTSLHNTVMLQNKFRNILCSFSPVLVLLTCPLSTCDNIGWCRPVENTNF